MELKDKLLDICGSEYVIDHEDPRFFAYGFGDATMYRSKPDYVVYPGSAEEIQELVRLAIKEKITIVPSGGLTGLSGGANIQKGILLNTARLRSIKSVDPIQKTVTVESGMSCAELNEHLAEYGFVIPVAPASHLISTLGGNIAEAAGGTWGMSKGTFKNYLLTMKVIDGEGNLFETARPFPKQSTGPDLTALFIGSEGTMGIIVEMTFRCDLLPEDTWTIRCSFKDESILQTIHEGIAERHINLYSFEYMDDKMMRCLGKENMLLLFQTAGSRHDAKAEAEKLVEFLKSLNPVELKYTNDPETADELYTERRSALGALGKADENKPVIVQWDPVLPVRKFAEGVQYMRQLAERENLELIVYGHAGDGNLHPSFIVPDDLQEKLKARKVIREFDEWIEKAGGVYSGEHAVGFFLGRGQDVIRPETGNYLRGIKKTFDPHGILNPGKVVDTVEPDLDIQAVLPEYKEIGKIVSTCVKCHLCKNDSPLFKKEPMEHNTIRGRVSMIDAATRGQADFDTILPYVKEMKSWTEDFECPTFFKEKVEKLYQLIGI